MLGQTLWLTPGDVLVGVHEGVVTLRGRLPRRSLIPITEQLCRAVDGVVAVHATLDWTEDDTDPHLEHPRAYRAAS
ncbi:BON domain-containing protein [Kitasatospora sp. NPDC101157]|uniref:BON domain-containing protein n=1 Tax=Kitasatospora sp. NPDC101157 TaxID=3364098 RepID=UPI003810D459